MSEDYACSSWIALLNLPSLSYDAAEDNELTFREGDRIVEIEAASDEWWQGKDKHGAVGLFPGKELVLLLCACVFG